MTKTIITSCVLLAFAMLKAQVSTNHEDSKYRFEKIKTIEATPVLNQGMSGTCWSFSALSFFESEIRRLGGQDPIILSEMFVVRNTYYEKAIKFIRMDGKTNFSQGGAFHDIPYIINRYGIVPLDVYSNKDENEPYINHDEVFNLLEGFMGGVLKTSQNLRKNQALTKKWPNALQGILDVYFGAIPEKFQYAGKEYTPKSFASFLKLNMNDYVSITSFTHFPEYTECMLAIPDNWGWGKSYNVPLQDLAKIAQHALKNGYGIAWGADVSESGFNFREGIALVPKDPSTILVSGSDNKNFSDAGATKQSNAFREPVEELTITAELRQDAYDNKTTQDDHGMHITGLYKEQNGGFYYLVKNSWGTNNHPQGYLFVSEAYLNYKTINLYLHKDALPKDIRKKLNL